MNEGVNEKRQFAPRSINEDNSDNNITDDDGHDASKTNDQTMTAIGVMVINNKDDCKSDRNDYKTFFNIIPNDFHIVISVRTTLLMPKS